jgi:cytoskeletal protein CcmA (bactofilin family)
MWGNKKTDGPQAGGPADSAAPKVPEQVPSSPVSQSTLVVPTREEKTMSTDAMRPLNTTPQGSTARLGASLHVKGEISGNEDLHIDGIVEGLIQLEDRKLTVGASSKLTADVVAREVVVYGSVKGNLRARDRIEIKKDGSVVGDLTTARIMIEDGAYFKGSIEIDRKAEGGEKDKEYSRAAVATPAASRTAPVATPAATPAVKTN